MDIGPGQVWDSALFGTWHVIHKSYCGSYLSIELLSITHWFVYIQWVLAGLGLLAGLCPGVFWRCHFCSSSFDLNQFAKTEKLMAHKYYRVYSIWHMVLVAFHMSTLWHRCSSVLWTSQIVYIYIWPNTDFNLNF